MDTVKKGLKIVGIIFGSLMLIQFIFVEIFLLKGDETSFGDITAVIRVSFGAQYVELSNTTDKDGNPEQTIMVKEESDLKKIFADNKCVMTGHLEDHYYNYKTASGKEFILYPMTRVPGGVYATFLLSGATMDDVKSKPSALN